MFKGPCAQRRVPLKGWHKGSRSKHSGSGFEGSMYSHVVMHFGRGLKVAIEGVLQGQGIHYTSTWTHKDRMGCPGILQAVYMLHDVSMVVYELSRVFAGLYGRVIRFSWRRTGLCIRTCMHVGAWELEIIYGTNKP